MNTKIKWEEVTTHDKLMEYIREVIGEHNLYDELYEDLLYGMIKNRELQQKQEKLNESISDMQGIIMPNGK
jgi:hypothetical protein